MPGNSTWTRGDGTRYRDPGVMVAWWGGKKEKAPVKAFTEWLKNHPKTKLREGLVWFITTKRCLCFGWGAVYNREQLANVYPNMAAATKIA
jgi:hypothetical protein